MRGTEVLKPLEKALQMNLDPTKYGTFAEIGAGQEVSNWFFRAGASNGTVAKTISAYGMTMSDAIYGSGVRYVSRARLEAMLDHEFDIVCDRLDEERGEDTTFFSFCDTVRARGYNDTDNSECFGWMGIRFRTEPRGPAHDILIHARLLDPDNTDQMDCLGILGVNLIHGAFFRRNNLADFIKGLLDNLSRRRAEIDMLKFSGPEFEKIDNRTCALLLVEHGLTDAALFSPNGEVMQSAEIFYGKPIFCMRGSFNPVTRVNLDMMESGTKTFAEDLKKEGSDRDPLDVVEITVNNLLGGVGELDTEDFLARADVLQQLGKTVLVSNFAEFHQLGQFFARYTKEPVGIILGTGLLEAIFQEKWYEGLDGGILESFGRLFKHSSRLYIYPTINSASQTMKLANNAEIAPHLQHLFDHLLTNGFIREIPDCLKECALRSSADIRQLIEDKDPEWKELVPPVVLEHPRWK